MNEYTLEEAKAALKPFGINIYTEHEFTGEIFAYRFQSNNGQDMTKPDGYDVQNLQPSDFNMIIDGFIE